MVFLIKNQFCIHHNGGDGFNQENAGIKNQPSLNQGTMLAINIFKVQDI